MKRKDERKWFEALKFAENHYNTQGLHGVQGLHGLREELAAEVGMLDEDSEHLLNAATDYMEHLKHLKDTEENKMVFDTAPNPSEHILLRMEQ